MPDTRLEWIDSDSGVPKLVERAPTQNVRQPPPADAIAKQNDQRMLQRLQAEFGKASDAVKQQVEDDKRSIRSKHIFAEANLKRQWDAEKDPKRRQALLNQKKTMESQTLSKLADIDNKYLPTNRTMKQAYDTEVGKLQQAAQQRNMKLQTIRQLAANNFITDPAVARQAEYKMLLGIDIPITALRPQRSPEQRKASLVRDIRHIDNILEQFTPAREKTLGDIRGLDIRWWGKKGATIVDPDTGKERKLNPDNGADAIIINNMRKLVSKKKENETELQKLYLQIPEFRAAVEDSNIRKGAVNMFLPKNQATKGGGIKESITNKINKQNKGKRIRVQSPSGQTGTVTEKELASYIAQGFKRI